MITMTKHPIKLPSGDEVAYWSHHDNNKPTLVLVHGFTGSHEGFQYLIPLLTDYHLIVPDLPGFGVSPLPHNRLTIHELGELLIGFIEELNLPEKPHLLGHSMGSLVVSEAIRQHPSLFAQKLILISPVPTPIGWADERRPGAIFSQLYYKASHHIPIVGKYIATSSKLTRFSTKLIITSKDANLRHAIHDHHLKNLDFISSIGRYSRLHSEINRTGISRYKASLRQFNVLLVGGDCDNVTPLRLQRQAAQKIGATLVTVPEVGHLAHYEKPSELADAIRHHLHT